MPRITRRTFGLGATAAAAAVAMPRVARAQEITLKLHQFLPAQANVPKLVLDPWIKKVQDESGGRIKIEHYPAMQLGGKPPELIDQVTDGIVDIVWTLPGSMASLDAAPPSVCHPVVLLLISALLPQPSAPA